MSNRVPFDAATAERDGREMEAERMRDQMANATRMKVPNLNAS